MSFLLSRVVFGLRRDQIALRLHTLEHRDVKARLVFEFEPKFTVAFRGFPRLKVWQLVLPGHFLLHRSFILFDAEDYVVLDDEGGAEAATSDMVFFDSDNRVVTGEAILLVHAKSTCLMRGNVQTGQYQRYLLLLDELAPCCNVGQCLQGVGPLTAQQATRRVLKVQSEQKRVFLVKVFRDDIGAQTEQLNKILSERARVHLLREVPPTELVVSLRVRLLEHVFEGFQDDKAFALVGAVRVPLQNGLSVTFSLSAGPCRFNGHLEAIVYSW